MGVRSGGGSLRTTSLLSRALRAPIACVSLLLLVAACSSRPSRAPWDASRSALDAPPASSLAAFEEPQRWEQLQAVGGLRVLDPVRLPDGVVLLPVACDVSGSSTITVQPSQRNSGRVVTRTESVVMGSTIQLRLVTGLPARGASAHAAPLELGRLAPGEYRVEYANPDTSRVPLRTVTVTEARAEPIPEDVSSGRARVPSSHFRGVIFTAAELGGRGAVGRWTPSPAEAFAAERRMLDALLMAAWNPDSALFEGTTPEQRAWQARELAKIVAHLDQYSFQCTGLIVDGQRRVYMNVFMVGSGDAMLKHALSEWITVVDGGFGFWNLQYDVATDRCLALQSHGYA